ncbi:MAG: oxidoreductase [Candidatus Omnitrophica bacterium]|nr:oxidoreductase [Candidatus Omnitrophota bacterium]
MSKPKIALYWCSSCGGCEESIVDLAEDILTVISSAEIVFWPVALDFKYEDLNRFSDGEIDAALINGAIRMSEQEQIVKLLRRKSKLIIAQGACAHLGGVVGLANFNAKKEILERAYKKVPTLKNDAGVFPQMKVWQDDMELDLPDFHKIVKPLDMVIDVDYYIPGCPPPPELIKSALLAVLENKLPQKGTVLAEKKALCESCSRRDTKPNKIKIKRFKRVYETELDENKCFLDQGVICLGIATRGGCNERCIKANQPCKGCFGPVDNVLDYGGKVLSAIASMIDYDTPEELEAILSSIPDLAGLFYRYSLASSILKMKLNKDKNNAQEDND